MTAVEFIDRTPIENIISVLTNSPKKVIYIGEADLIEKKKHIYISFVKSRNLDIDVLFKTINKNNINSILDVLSDIVENEDNCVFDLTGGSDLVLVAMGMIAQKYQNKKNTNAKIQYK